MAKYGDALRRADQIQTWSSNYKGRVPYDQEGTSQMLESDWHKERASAERQIQVTAAFKGFDLVFDLRFERKLETNSEPSHSGRGTHYYNVPKFKAFGRAARKRDGRRDSK